MKNHYLKKMKSKSFLIVIASALFVSFESCKKEASKETIPQPIENMDKMVKYLSVTLSVSQDQVKFNSQTNQFFVPNTVFRADLKEIQKFYSEANEYKLNYE